MKKDELERKKESREIVQTIIDFGVTEDQKFDIMFNLAITLENNETMKEIANFLKKYTATVNEDKKESKILKKPNKILMS